MEGDSRVLLQLAVIDLIVRERERQLAEETRRRRLLACRDSGAAEATSSLPGKPTNPTPTAKPARPAGRPSGPGRLNSDRTEPQLRVNPRIAGPAPGQRLLASRPTEIPGDAR
jgi:hypothetical protein